MKRIPHSHIALSTRAALAAAPTATTVIGTTEYHARQAHGYAALWQSGPGGTAPSRVGWYRL